MKPSIHKFAFTVLLSLAVIGVAVSGTAQEKQEKAKAGGAPAKGGTYPYQGQVKAADSTEMLVTLSGKEKDRVIKVTSETRIAKENKPAAFGDIKPGEEIRGQVKKVDNKEEAVTLNLGPFPEKKVKKKEEKK